MRALLILFLCPVFLFAQKINFEGVIVYSINYVIHDTNYKVEQLQQRCGVKMTCYIKNGKYRQEYLNSLAFQYVIYNNETNLYSYKLKFSDTLYQMNCKKYSDKGLIEVTDSMKFIAGYNCKKVTAHEYRPPIDIQYYFAEDLYLNPKFFRKHKLAGYNKLLEKTHSIYLESITDYGPYTVILTAESVKFQDLEDKLFDMPNLPQKSR
ncbi:MAG: hypothetical protein IPH88_02855 [Bacteroidales bacterium]|nr:hypothetical protein [Bacteroidales bacterium]